MISDTIADAAAKTRSYLAAPSNVEIYGKLGTPMRDAMEHLLQHMDMVAALAWNAAEFSDADPEECLAEIRQRFHGEHPQIPR